MPQLFSPLVERALRVAADAHREQLRKGSSLPYLTHPAGVAILLLRAGFHEEDILAAALLHDVVEDTDQTLAGLAKEFPPAVVEMVEALSETKFDADGRKRPWKDRKVEHIENVRRGTVGIKAVVLADKLHNLGCMQMDYESEGDHLWERFHASPAEIHWYHREMIDAADGDDPRLARLQESCRQILRQLNLPG